MFSANENILLRTHKRRICQFVEDCIPEEVLDLGTNVMVMQVSCRAPGCVPLETLICIVFPSSNKELLEGLAESAGGTYKAKVLKPMAEVTKEDVLDALPPQFLGGRRSMERICRQARDVMLSQITQIMGEDDVDGKKIMAKYLQQCLQEYMDHGCEAPSYGVDYSDDKDSKEEGDTNKEISVDTSEEKKSVSGKVNEESPKTTKGVAPYGNFVIRRGLGDDNVASLSSESSTSKIEQASGVTETATDWRRRQKLEQSIVGVSSSKSMIERLAEREHAPGARQPGCPCCDPDNLSNVVDTMLASMI